MAFALSITGFIAAVMPGLSIFAWVLILAAFVMSIITLTKKQKRALSVISLVLSLVSGVWPFIVSLVTLLAVGVGAIAEAGDKMNASADEIRGGIVQVLTTQDGLDLLFNSVECGAAEYEGTYSTETAAGDFCVVSITLTNNGEEASTMISTSNFGALVGDYSFDAVNALDVGGFGKDKDYTIELNPGLSTEGEIVVGVPVGTVLDAVTYADLFGEEIAIAAR